MRAPEFWSREPGWAAEMLAPLAATWSLASRARTALAHPYRAPVPVVCVGNLVVGGAGKTPVVLSLCRLAAERGLRVGVVTRGYGGRLAGPLRVEAERHAAADTGDEALLIARRGVPCWVGRDRAAAIRAAAASGLELIVLDDGFQNPTFAKDLAIVVVDSEYGFGNARVMPAGPLREPVAAGLARAGAVALIGDGEPPAAVAASGRPVLRAFLQPVAGERLFGQRVIGFAGIGRPAKFFRSLERLGAHLCAAHAFADHHRYGSQELDMLRREASRLGARLVTTAKDWVRLPRDWRHGIEVLEVEIRWQRPAEIMRLLEPLLPAARRHPT